MNLDKLDPNLKTLYETMQNTQTDIHSEVIMAREIGQYSSHFLKDEVIEKFKDQIAKYKQHYAMISMIYLLENCKIKSLPLNNVTSFNSSKFTINEKEVEEQWKDGNLLSTLQFLNGKEQNFPQLINFLTFSIIPSLFVSFLEVDAFNSFTSFINSLPQKLQTLFSRSLFVSPFFLKFIHLIFYSDLKPFYEDIFEAYSPDFNTNLFDFLRAKLLTSIRSNINLLPSFIPQFLNTFDDQNKRELILKQALFEPLIEHPAMYSVVDSFIFENDEKYSIISNILKNVLTDNFIHEFDQILLSSKFFYNAFVNKQAVDQHFSSLKNFYIYNSFDEIIMNNIDEIKIKTEQDSPDSLYNFIKDREINDYCLFYELSYDFMENDKIYKESGVIVTNGWTFVKELLKKSPPLPPIEDKNDTSNDKGSEKSKSNTSCSKTDFLNLVKSTLVDQYDPMSSISGELSFRVVQSHTSFNSKKYKSNFEKLVTKHTEVDDMINAAQTLIYEIKDMTYKTNHILSQNSEFFVSFMTKDIEPSINRIFKAHDAIKDPIQTVKNMVSYVEAANLLIKPIIGDFDSNIILARRFYANFRFNNFLLFRPDLIVYDQLLENFFANNFKYIIEETKNNKKLKKTIKTRLLNDIQKLDYSHKIIMAFESNSDPFSKMNSINLVMEDLISFVLSGCGDVGEDEKRIVTKFFFAYANPPRLLSNLVFLLEFCNFKEKSGYITILSQLCKTYSDRISVLFSNIEEFSFDLANIPRTDYYIELQRQQRQQQQHQQQEDASTVEVPWLKRLKQKLLKK